jgi:outer membrane protein assembly factor BamB
MRRLLPILCLVACGHAATGREVAVAPPVTVPITTPTGTDVHVDGVMGVAWSRGTGYKPWAAAGDSILVLSERGGDVDVVDPRSGRTRTFPIGDTVSSLLSTNGPMVLAATQNRILALDPTGGVLWSTGLTRAATVSQIAPISAGILVLLPVDEHGYPRPRLLALGRADGGVVWGLTLPPSNSAGMLASLGSSVLLWSTASGLVSWSVLDEKDGHTLAQGEESGSRMVVRGRRFVICDERQGLARIHAAGNETAHTIAYPGMCSEMVIDDDTIYSMRSNEKDADEVRALAMTDGAERWTRKVPTATGGLAHGPWLLVPSNGGIVRAMRRDNGDVAWSYGVGSRAMLSTFDPSTVLAAGNNSLHALQAMTSLPPERTSEIILRITNWGCVDKASTTLFVGDVAAQPDGPDRFTARVQGRGQVIVRSTPWVDVIPMSHERDSRDWSYAPAVADLDGARHEIPIELDNCDED